MTVMLCGPSPGRGASLVAAAAGLTKGAVYSSFSGKDELFFALVADAQVQTIDRILAHAARHPTIYLPTHDPDAVTRLNAGTTL